MESLRDKEDRQRGLPDIVFFMSLGIAAWHLGGWWREKGD